MELDIFFILGNGIGNVISGLYAVEYVLKQKSIRVGFCAIGVSDSFQNYLKDCYGSTYFHITKVVNIQTKFLIHSFLVDSIPLIIFKNYFYVNADVRSTFYQSETEQYISIAKSLFPAGYESKTLNYLKEEEPKKLKLLDFSEKFVLYPGCDPKNAAKRWPYYSNLMKIVGEEKVIVVGSNEDLDYSYSYVYPRFISAIIPQKLLDRKQVWSFLKRMRILCPFSQQSELTLFPKSFFGDLTWYEIVYILKRCLLFIGNDGGLTHLAASVGAHGISIFGPTSIEKNKSFNENIRPVSVGADCQPCQFQKAGIKMSRGFINCPYSVKCLSDLDAILIYSKIREVLALLLSSK